MTKEITKARILQELQDKFGMREFTPTPFLFDETVIPVYDVGKHLESWKTETKTLSVTSATNYLFYTVPMNEKWYLKLYDVVFMATGAYKVSGAYLQRAKYPATFMYMDLTKNQTESYHVDLLVPVVLEPGDQIRVNVDDYTSTASLKLNIDYKKEEIR